MRLFAYNHALNQNRPKTSALAGTGTKWKVRVWKNNKVVKTLTVEKDDEPFVTAKVKGLGIDWDKATVHDPKTMKQQKSYKNANAGNSKSSTPQKTASSNPEIEKVLQTIKRFKNKIQQMVAASQKDYAIYNSGKLGYGAQNFFETKDHEYQIKFNKEMHDPFKKELPKIGKFYDNKTVKSALGDLFNEVKKLKFGYDSGGLFQYSTVALYRPK